MTALDARALEHHLARIADALEAIAEAAEEHLDGPREAVTVQPDPPGVRVAGAVLTPEAARRLAADLERAAIVAEHHQRAGE